MTVAVARSVVSLARGRLVDLMRDIGFGTVEGLIILAGQPVLRPAPRIVREVKLAGESSCPPINADDFALKAQVIALFAQFDEIGDGRIERLEIKHGLPFRMVIESSAGGTSP